MASECLLPQDLFRFLSDSGSPDTLCSLFLRFPVTSAALRFSALEYFWQLLKVLMIDFWILRFFDLGSNWRQTLRRSSEINFLVHPVVFFVAPFLYSQVRLSIGLALLSNAVLYVIAKWFFMRRFMDFSKRYAWTLPLVSLFLAWYSASILSF